MNYLFDIEYTNNAWGYQHNGIVILGDGNVYKYDVSDIKQSDVDITTKLENSRLIDTIPPNDMSMLYNELISISSYQLTPSKRDSYDSGNTRFSGYIHIDKHTWNEIILGYKGNNISYNRDSNAKLLVDQLSNVYSNYLLE
jgi:hypothetical protein